MNTSLQEFDSVIKPSPVLKSRVQKGRVILLPSLNCIEDLADTPNQMIRINRIAS
jgi:hypothetical protein